MKYDHLMLMKKLLLAACLSAAILLAGCRGRIHEAAEEAVSQETRILMMEVSEVPQLEICSFSDGLDGFIACYNSCCAAYGNRNLLQDGAGWHYTEGCWHYRQFEDIWLEPELQVYVDSGDVIREIRIGFEDHGYTEWGEALSEERAFYTLRCLCEKQSDAEIRQIIEDVKTDMKRQTAILGQDESPAAANTIPLGGYELYHFYSGGLFFLCVTEQPPA